VSVEQIVGERKRRVSQPQYGMRLEKTAMPLSDGVRLAVTLYMSDGAESHSTFPALLEYLPYRRGKPYRPPRRS
jgi:predicted acyl esterase